MRGSERLGSVRRLNESRELSAARALGRSVRRVREQEQRLSELERYREEYRRQLEEMGAGGVVAARLQEMRGFLHNLDLAIEGQRHSRRLRISKQSSATGSVSRLPRIWPNHCLSSRQSAQLPGALPTGDIDA